MHEIGYRTFSSRYGQKRIVKECNDMAIERSDQHTGLYKGIRFFNAIYPNYQAALKFIDANDRGDYDNLAARYKDKRAIRWLVKFEYHC